jgi:hypothetical protein
MDFPRAIQSAVRNRPDVDYRIPQQKAFRTGGLTLLLDRETGSSFRPDLRVGG